MRELAELNTLPGMDRPNASNSIYMLLDEPLVGEMLDTVPPATLELILSTCQRVEQTLREAIASTRDPESVEEMIYSTRMMAYAAKKLRACQQIRHQLETVEAGEGDARALLSEGIETLRALEAELVELIDRFQDLWLRRARRSEMSITMDHFDKLRGRLWLAERWLQERLDVVEMGETPSYNLAAYADEAGLYEILGQTFWRKMHEAGVTLH
jgi:hypothetical protein